tara:strand:+ start:101093 stop:101359 length:267 start_codon:yes stop_codon:yes gene_type:complete
VGTKPWRGVGVALIVAELAIEDVEGSTSYFKIDEALEGLIYENASLLELRQQARDQGMRTLREDGLRKVLAGWTTLSEVLAVTVGDAD